MDWLEQIEFFGAADRISSQTGEWKLLRPLRKRLAEWGDPLLRKAPQWTLEEILKMPNSMVLGLLSEKKMPGKMNIIPRSTISAVAIKLAVAPMARVSSASRAGRASAGRRFFAAEPQWTWRTTAFECRRVSASSPPTA